MRYIEMLNERFNVGLFNEQIIDKFNIELFWSFLKKKKVKELKKSNG